MPIALLLEFVFFEAMTFLFFQFNLDRLATALQGTKKESNLSLLELTEDMSSVKLG